jgi:hypothetical protein
MGTTKAPRALARIESATELVSTWSRWRTGEPLSPGFRAPSKIATWPATATAWRVNWGPAPCRRYFASRRGRLPTILQNLPRTKYNASSKENAPLPHQGNRATDFPIREQWGKAISHLAASRQVPATQQPRALVRWTIGAGWRHAWTNNLTFKHEYLFASFPTTDAFGAIADGNRRH